MNENTLIHNNKRSSVETYACNFLTFIKKQPNSELGHLFPFSDARLCSQTTVSIKHTIFKRKSTIYRPSYCCINKMLYSCFRDLFKQFLWIFFKMCIFFLARLFVYERDDIEVCFVLHSLILKSSGWVFPKGPLCLFWG